MSKNKSVGLCGLFREMKDCMKSLGGDDSTQDLMDCRRNEIQLKEIHGRPQLADRFHGEILLNQLIRVLQRLSMEFKFLEKIRFRVENPT
jgi:hypothetical protein